MKRGFSLLETLITTGRRPGVKKFSGFSLLETLIATGVLLVVTSAAVALSNSLVRGTVSNADTTIVDRWLAEGAELTTKIRDENVKSNSLWLSQARSFIYSPGSGYGWYKLDTGGVLTAVSSGAIAKSFVLSQGEQLISGSLIAGRLVCIEAVSAPSPTDVPESAVSLIRCNQRDNTNVDDGSRSITNQCDPSGSDLYCLMSKDSLNRNTINPTPKIIPAGNAAKVRVYVVWQNKDAYKVRSMATILTNWKSNVF